MTTLRLKATKHQRVRSGHLWIFRDELVEVPEIVAGSLVRVLTDYDYDLGVGFYNAQSQITVRLLSYKDEVNEQFFVKRISVALQLRERLFSPETAYRLVFGESDFLPGLIIDRYGDYLSVQFLSAGMDIRAKEIVDAALQVLPRTKGIIAKNDSQLRTKEGLARSTEILFGEIPESLVMTENHVQYSISLHHGQKTGYFLDQRLNRKFVHDISRGLRVLDCFTNQGGFALNAARGGASEVVGIDSSESAIASCNLNASINQFNNCSFIGADVFDFLKGQTQSNAKWDMVILDPPAFTKSKANIAQAKRGYSEINRQALKLINTGGFLVSASCSHHITEEILMKIIHDEGVRINRKLKLIYRGMQSPCHPIYLPMPETQYLKFFVFEVW